MYYTFLGSKPHRFTVFTRKHRALQSQKMDRTGMSVLMLVLAALALQVLQRGSSGKLCAVPSNLCAHRLARPGVRGIASSLPGMHSISCTLDNRERRDSAAPVCQGVRPAPRAAAGLSSCAISGLLWRPPNPIVRHSRARWLARWPRCWRRSPWLARRPR